MTLCTPCHNIEHGHLSVGEIEYQPRLDPDEMCPRCAHTREQERQEMYGEQSSPKSESSSKKTTQMGISRLDKEKVSESMSILNRLRLDWDNVSEEEQHGSVVEAYHQLEQAFDSSQ